MNPIPVVPYAVRNSAIITKKERPPKGPNTVLIRNYFWYFMYVMNYCR